MHSKGKGMSSSALPYRRSAPSWLKTTPAEVSFDKKKKSRSWRRAGVFFLPARSRQGRPPPGSEAAAAREAAGQASGERGRGDPKAMPPALSWDGGPSFSPRRAGGSLGSTSPPPPPLLSLPPPQVTDHICKLAKKGLRPSQIGVVLRDSHGVAQVSSVTGSKVLRILKGQGLAPEIPEDLYFLIKKAVSMRKHLDSFRKDRDGKFRLILVESRIHRLARYYKRAKKLPPTWKYESATASALVS